MVENSRLNKLVAKNPWESPIAEQVEALRIAMVGMDRVAALEMLGRLKKAIPPRAHDPRVCLDPQKNVEMVLYSGKYLLVTTLEMALKENGKELD